MLGLGLIIAAVVVVIDQATKFWVLEGLTFSPPGCLTDHIGCGRIEISPIFDLTMVWNYGISFGFLRADSAVTRWGLVALSLVISAIFFQWLTRTVNRLQAVALGLVIGGALGNVIDRIRFGAVADFLDFRGLYFVWVFNVADAAITVGAGLLLLDFLRSGRKAPA